MTNLPERRLLPERAIESLEEYVAADGGQALAKACEARPTPFHSFRGQVAVFVQAIALAHGFLEVFHPLDVAELIAPDF